MDGLYSLEVEVNKSNLATHDYAILDSRNLILIIQQIQLGDFSYIAGKTNIPVGFAQQKYTASAQGSRAS